MLLALQGAVGLDQYETHLPTELVWVHVGARLLRLDRGAVGGLRRRAAGVPRGARSAAERPAEGPLAGVAPLKFPGN